MWENFVEKNQVPNSMIKFIKNERIKNEGMKLKEWNIERLKEWNNEEVVRECVL